MGVPMTDISAVSNPELKPYRSRKYPVIAQIWRVNVICVLFNLSSSSAICLLPQIVFKAIPKLPQGLGG
jgi:hypothetical protein